ncbi:hypothetical protein [Caldimonas brevitalea]|uniref:Uncharacterized protein n=1 Tax=Caldimonas brevitalea TaxID=413882 RepID=A0A0G3BQM9_9BURK|nr:hypothetical protein [Caldimonas brevitalea]AKJ28820.1 hypothetical protein AAW51_2129 [Caldimonas brevitalea]
MANFDKFFDYFRENMEALNLPAPKEMYGNVTLALGSVTALEMYIQKYGSKVTVRELLGAGLRADKLVTLGAMQASYYLGAVIGSLGVATARCMGNGLTLSEILFSASHAGVNTARVAGHLARHPEIYDSRMPSRSNYAARAIA